MKRLLIAAAIATATFASSAPSANAQTPAVTYTGIGTVFEPRAYTLGWGFNLSAPITVTHLGVWTGSGTGDFLAAIWKNDGTLLTSTTVLASDPASNGFRWGSIASLVLGAGDYVVAAEYRGTHFPSDATGVSRIPNLTWSSGSYKIGSGLNFPSDSGITGFGDNGFLWANFAVSDPVSTVPEPSTWALMFVGLTVIGVSRRRSAKAGQP